MRLIDADEIMPSLRLLWIFGVVSFGEGAKRAEEIINNVPTIEAEPVKHGRWREYNYPGQECVYCSACKTEYYPDDLIVIGVNDYPYYCPNCGAKMDLEGEEA